MLDPPCTTVSAVEVVEEESIGELRRLGERERRTREGVEGETYRAQNGVHDGTGTEPRRRLRTELQAPVHKSFDNWLRTLPYYYNTCCACIQRFI